MGRSHGTEPLKAEHLAILHGLHVSTSKDLLRVIVESDSSTTVVLLNDQQVGSQPHPHEDLIDKCVTLQRKIWSCGVTFVPRCFNISADAVCKLGHALALPTYCIFLEVPPRLVGDIVISDKVM